MSEVNIPLLRKAVEWAEAEAAKPEEQCAWDQMNWVAPHASCGTAYCIAGYVVAAIGGHKVVGRYVEGEGRRNVPDVAAEALGIEPPMSKVAPECGHLFNGDNTIEDVRRIAEDLAGERL